MRKDRCPFSQAQIMDFVYSVGLRRLIEELLQDIDPEVLIEEIQAAGGRQLEENFKRALEGNGDEGVE